MKLPKHATVFNDADKEEIRLRKANNHAYCNLALARQRDIGFDLANNIVTANLQVGDAHVAWKRLKEIFDPQDATDKVRLQGEITRLKLSDWKENPEV